MPRYNYIIYDDGDLRERNGSFNAASIMDAEIILKEKLNATLQLAYRWDILGGRSVKVMEYGNSPEPLPYFYKIVCKT